MRYSGKIGYAQQLEISPGVWDEIIAEHACVGDVVQRTETLVTSDSMLPQYRTTTSVSVLSGGLQKLRYSDIRYVWYMGVRWTISSIVNLPPRLILYFGEEYHGPEATTPDDSE